MEVRVDGGDVAASSIWIVLWGHTGVGQAGLKFEDVERCDCVWLRCQMPSSTSGRGVESNEAEVEGIGKGSGCGRLHAFTDSCKD